MTAVWIQPSFSLVSATADIRMLRLLQRLLKDGSHVCHWGRSDVNTDGDKTAAGDCGGFPDTDMTTIRRIFMGNER